MKKDPKSNPSKLVNKALKKYDIYLNDPQELEGEVYGKNRTKTGESESEELNDSFSNVDEAELPFLKAKVLAGVAPIPIPVVRIREPGFRSKPANKEEFGTSKTNMILTNAIKRTNFNPNNIGIDDDEQDQDPLNYSTQHRTSYSQSHVKNLFPQNDNPSVISNTQLDGSVNSKYQKSNFGRKAISSHPENDSARGSQFVGSLLRNCEEIRFESERRTSDTDLNKLDMWKKKSNTADNLHKMKVITSEIKQNANKQFDRTKYDDQMYLSSLAQYKLKEDRKVWSTHVNQRTKTRDISHRMDSATPLGMPRNISFPTLMLSLEKQKAIGSAENIPEVEEVRNYLKSEQEIRSRPDFRITTSIDQKNSTDSKFFTKTKNQKSLEKQIVSNIYGDPKIMTDLNSIQQTAKRINSVTQNNALFNKRNLSTHSLTPQASTFYPRNSIDSILNSRSQYIQKPREPLMKLGNPPSRMEAQLWKEWLFNSLEKLKTSLEEKDFLGEAQLLYNFIFLELTRQVSVTCLERGELMKMAWEGYYQANEKILQIIRTETEERDQNIMTKFIKRKEEFKNKLAHYTEAIKRKDLEIVNLNDKLKDIQNKNDLYKKVKEEDEIKYALAQQQINELLGKVRNLTSKVEALNLFQRNSPNDENETTPPHPGETEESRDQLQNILLRNKAEFGGPKEKKKLKNRLKPDTPAVSIETQPKLNGKPKKVPPKKGGILYSEVKKPKKKVLLRDKIHLSTDTKDLYKYISQEKETQYEFDNSEEEKKKAEQLRLAKESMIDKETLTDNFDIVCTEHIKQNKHLFNLLVKPLKKEKRAPVFKKSEKVLAMTLNPLRDRDRERDQKSTERENKSTSVSPSNRRDGRSPIRIDSSSRNDQDLKLQLQLPLEQVKSNESGEIEKENTLQNEPSKSETIIEGEKNEEAAQEKDNKKKSKLKERKKTVNLNQIGKKKSMLDANKLVRKPTVLDKKDLSYKEEKKLEHKRSDSYKGLDIYAKTKLEERIQKGSKDKKKDSSQDRIKNERSHDLLEQLEKKKQKLEKYKTISKDMKSTCENLEKSNSQFALEIEKLKVQLEQKKKQVERLKLLENKKMELVEEKKELEECIQEIGDENEILQKKIQGLTRLHKKSSNLPLDEESNSVPKSQAEKQKYPKILKKAPTSTIILEKKNFNLKNIPISENDDSQRRSYSERSGSAELLAKKKNLHDEESIEEEKISNLPIKQKARPHAANNLLQNISEDPNKAKKGIITKKIVLKSISLYYKKMLKQYGNELKDFSKSFTITNSLVEFIYDSLKGMYRTKNFYEDKFLKLLNGVKEEGKTNDRIKLFGRFLTVFDPPLDKENFQFYLKGLYYLKFVCNIGVDIKSELSAPEHFTPFVRAFEFYKFYFEKKYTPEEFEKGKKEIENLKESDPNNINTRGIINIDTFMMKMIERYDILVGKTRDYIKDVFNAGDLDGNEVIEKTEFILLYKHLEKKRFNYDEVSMLFDKITDTKVILNHEKEIPAVSFNRFAHTCFENNLFSPESQNEFLGSNSPSHYIELVTDLSKNFEGRMGIIEKRFEESGYETDLIQIFRPHMEKICNQIDLKKARVAWLMYRLLLEESIDSYIESKTRSLLGCLRIFTQLETGELTLYLDRSNVLSDSIIQPKKRTKRHLIDNLGVPESYKKKMVKSIQNEAIENSKIIREFISIEYHEKVDIQGSNQRVMQYYKEVEENSDLISDNSDIF